jgi:hypothetical protein
MLVYQPPAAICKKAGLSGTEGWGLFKMLAIYDQQGPGLVKRDGMAAITDASVWIDLLNPTAEEDLFVEKALGISVPTRAEMREIEASNRLYQENGAHFMTAFIVYNVEAPVPLTTALTFILAGQSFTARPISLSGFKTKSTALRPVFLRSAVASRPARAGSTLS